MRGDRPLVRYRPVVSPIIIASHVVRRYTPPSPPPSDVAAYSSAMLPLDDAAPLDLLGLQVAALFHHDQNGRIVSKNKPVYAPAPRLFLGRSTGGNLWRFRDDVPDHLIATLTPLLAREPVPDALVEIPTVQVEIVAALAQHQPIVEVYAGPAWRIPTGRPAPSQAVLVTPADDDAFRPHFPTVAEHLAAMSPCAAVIEEGVAVTVCFSARTSPTVSEAGLDTVETARGRGYGVAAVLAWASAVRAAGRLPLYSTSWDNTASRRVAEKLEAVQYAVDLSIY